MRLPDRRPARRTTRPRHTRAVLVAVAALALTAGCTGGADDPGTGATPSDGVAADAGQPAPVDDVATQVVAEQTVSTPSEAGGEVTLVLRDVRVDDQVLTVRWALTWDAPDQADDASASLLDLGVDPTPLVTDTTHLQAFLPLCVKGDWNGAAVDRQECRQTMLASPRDHTTTRLQNHATLEGWAALPAPETPGGSLDVLVADGLPAFTGVTARQAS